MSNILLLARTQLKIQLDLSGKTTKDLIFKFIFSILKFVLITAIIFVAFYLLGYFKWVSLDGSIPIEVLTVVLTAMLILSLITCIIKITDSLYFSKDNKILLTLPATKSQIFIARLIQFFFYELLKNIYFLLPLFIAYGMTNHYATGYYFWLIPCWILFTLLIVSIGGLLSIPYMLATIQLKRHFWLKIIMAVIGITIIIVAIIKLILILPDNFNLVETWGTTYWKIQDFLTGYSEKIFIIASLSKFVAGSKINKVITIFSGNTLITLAWIAGIIIVTLSVSIIITRFLFFRMASYPFEYKISKVNKPKKNTELPSLLSFIKKEIILIFRTPYRINSLITFAILTPMAIFLLNKIYSTMEVRAVGRYMIFSFNMLMITLLATSSNATISTSLSEEGNCFYITKVNPNKFINSLLPKIILNIVVMTISIIISVCVFTTTMSVKPVQAILIFMIIESLYLSHCLWSAELDIMNPQYQHYQSEGTMINNPNEVKSTVLAFVFSVLIGVFTFVNLNENILNYVVAWTKLLIVAIAFLIFRIYMYKTQTELYFKEK